jgi:hypothetical protein
LLYRSPAVKTYEQFAEAVLRGQEAEARKLIQGDAAGRDLDRHVQEVGMERRTSQLVGSSYRVGAERAAGGKVTVEATQVVRWDPPGATSAMGAVRITHAQRAVLEKTAAGYRVVAFEDKIVDRRDWKGQPL